MNSSLAPVARTLLSLIFLVSGSRKLMAFAAVSGMMAKRGFPAPDVFLTLSILLDLAGGVLLIANWNVRYVAGALAAYTFAAGALFHGFWDSWNARSDRAALQSRQECSPRAERRLAPL
jgi:putative oxidoreductase